MYLKIDFNSEEAFYVQLYNQIIFGIATSRFREGDTLPSVRQLADEIGINMHTVNKAYSILKQEGYIRLDRRYGAVIALDVDKMKALIVLWIFLGFVNGHYSWWEMPILKKWIVFLISVLAQKVSRYLSASVLF